MRGMQGRIFKKLKFIPHSGYLKQGRVLHLGFSNDFFREEDEGYNPMTNSNNDDDEKENAIPVSVSPRRKRKDLFTENQSSDLDVTQFRRPDPNSSTLFDPNLLSLFNQAVMEYKARIFEAVEAEQSHNREEEEEGQKQQHEDPLVAFDERHPPGWMGSVILYTTSLRGIRKTFEDCNSVRFLLKSLKVMFYERDVSMHMEFREELWRVLGGRAIPPRLFIKGRYIGGADEVLALHEQGKLRPLLTGLPLDLSGGAACDECGGMKFVVCSECCGSRRVYGEAAEQCQRCNENGLALCSLCC